MSRTTLSTFKEKALSKTDVRKEYEALELTYELRKALISLRQQAGLTQEQIADLLNTKKGNISRLENVNSEISPKLSTIENYANVVGYKVKISFEPNHSV